MTSHTRSRPPCDATPSEADLLAEVLGTVETSLPTDQPHAPVAIGLRRPRPDEIELAVRTLPGDDPVLALAGFMAPADWSAFGVVAEGQAWPVGPPGTAGPSPRSRSDRVRFGLMGSRSGRWAAAVRSQGDFAPVAVADPIGRIPDACRRVLGLPTAAPEHTVGQLLATLWLDGLLSDALARPGQHDLRALHDQLATVAALLAADRHRCDHRSRTQTGGPDATPTWADLRAEAARGSHDWPFPPELAAWMDDGMFSREVVAWLPEVDDLLDDLEPVLAPEPRAAVAATFDRAHR